MVFHSKTMVFPENGSLACTVRSLTYIFTIVVQIFAPSIKSMVFTECIKSDQSNVHHFLDLALISLAPDLPALAPTTCIHLHGGQHDP